MKNLRCAAPLAAFCAVLAVTGCQPTAAPSPAAAGGQTPVTPAAAITLPVTDVAALEAHLAARGIRAGFEGEHDLGYLGPPGRIYSLGGEDTLEVHTYPDAAAAEQAVAGVAPDGSSIIQADGERIAVAWLGTPYFFRSGPLVAVYVGTTPATLGALIEAMGPPFAGGKAR